MSTIVAQATSAGYSGVAVVRASGPLALLIAQKITGRSKFAVRQAVFTTFYDAEENPFDQGLCIYFKGPQSFTGEDVVEWHAHGSPVVTSILMDVAISYGAMMARPGEFSQRAFLNQKIDLIQAEAICDLIHSQNAQAARGAFFSMRGVFSKKMHAFSDAVMLLRSFVEADINFAEDVENLDMAAIQNHFTKLISQLEECLAQSKASSYMQQGIRVALIGHSNVGKSSLFNLLMGKNQAIVTDLAGTTRDLIVGQFNMGPISIELTDTAGFRDTQDPIEKIGIQRAKTSLEQMDLIILLGDVLSEQLPDVSEFKVPVIRVFNKLDLNNPDANKQADALYISVKESIGIDVLKKAILSKVMGDDYNFEQIIETPFLARKRHVVHLQDALAELLAAQNALCSGMLLEIVAEHLSETQLHFAHITGQVSHEDLLQSIFSNFCLGK